MPTLAELERLLVLIDSGLISPRKKKSFWRWSSKEDVTKTNDISSTSISNIFNSKRFFSWNNIQCPQWHRQVKKERSLIRSTAMQIIKDKFVVSRGWVKVHWTMPNRSVRAKPNRTGTQSAQFGYIKWFFQIIPSKKINRARTEPEPCRTSPYSWFRHGSTWFGQVLDATIW